MAGTAAQRLGSTDCRLDSSGLVCAELQVVLRRSDSTRQAAVRSGSRGLEADEVWAE